MEQNKNSPQIVPKKKAAQTKLAKDNPRYWNEKVFKEDGKPNFTVRMQLHGKQRKISLRTGSKKEAAKKATEVFAQVSEHGWEKGLQAAFGEVARAKTNATVGDWLAAAEKTGLFRPKTFRDEASKLRKIADCIILGEVPKKSEVDPSRFGQGKEAAAWKAKAESLPLEQLTDAQIVWWRKEFKKNAKTPLEEARATRSGISYIGAGKSFFRPEVVEAIKATGEIVAPTTLPFRAIKQDKKPSSQYHSEIQSPEALLIAARRDLWELTADQLRDASYSEQGLDPNTVQTNEQETLHFQTLAQRHRAAFQFIVLGLVCGLRRGEADKLTWPQVNTTERNIHIRITDYHAPKSDSSGKVPFEPELIPVLNEWSAEQGEDARFVIAGTRPEDLAPSEEYRAKKAAKIAAKWLRGKGITANKPVHSLRKEYGSDVCNQAGIYAASKHLRQKNTRVTEEHYLENKKQVTPNFGKALAGG